MSKLEKRRHREYQTELDITQISGASSWASHTNLVANQFRELNNVDIYSGGNEDYLKSRSGSQYLRPLTGELTWGSGILNSVVWDVGDEYLIAQVGINLYSQDLRSQGNPTLIYDFDGVTAVTLAILPGLGSATKARFVVDEDRLLIFHPSGNKVLEWDSSAARFKGRNMGMKRVYANDIDVTNTGLVSGRYVYAVEKCYQINDGDFLCSGVNRLIHRLNSDAPGEYIRTGIIELKRPIISLSAANFFGKVLFAAGGYTNAVAGDLGGVVNFSGSGATGILKEYNNTYRYWWVDITSGTPSTSDAVTITAGTGAGTTISSLDLNQQDNLWTHIKLYRSKNLLPDITDPLNVIEPGGTEDDMWHVATITKAEMEASGLTAVETSANAVLPPGNDNILAGTVGETFQIQDNNTDDALISVASLFSLELLPMPACYLGAYHANRIWASRVNAAAWDDGIAILDETQSNIYYSPPTKLFYKEQSRIDFFKETGKDGQTITVLNQFERDLFICKEDRTMRLPDGNLALEVEITDHDQGIVNDNFFLFVPELGICGITSDSNDFKIYGFDHVWRGTFNGIEIGKDYRTQTQGLQASDTNMMFLNGKLFINGGSGIMYILHVDQKRGWTTYEYPTLNSARVAAFGGGTQGLYIGDNQYTVEIEKSGLNDDINTVYATNDAIQGSWTTYMFRSGGGRHVLEHESLSIMAKLSYDMTAVPYMNGLTWPVPYTSDQTDFFPPPNYETQDSFKDREYRLFIEPKPIGDYLWNRLIGNFLHYVIATRAPFIIKSHRLNCIVDEDGNRVGNFDPLQSQLKYAGWHETPWPLTLVDTLNVTNTVTDALTNTDTFTEHT